MRYQIFSSGKCEILNICSIGYGESPEITHFGPGKRNLYILIPNLLLQDRAL